MRSEQELLQVFARLRRSTAGNSRAPHKPLLALVALSLWQNRGINQFSYDDVERLLYPVLREFVPARVKNVSPERPFFHLQHDNGVWCLIAPRNPDGLKALKEPSKRFFRENNVFGTFSDDVWAHLESSPQFLPRMVANIMVNNFTPSIYSDVLEAVGIRLGNLGYGATDPIFDFSLRRRRDPDFKMTVLEAYAWRCAVCAFEATLGGRNVGVEAAHIQWHSHSGPDSLQNGVALCALHHHLFDRGVFTITDERTVQVSSAANGSAMFDHVVRHFDGHDILKPRTGYQDIGEQYRAWHVAEVFAG